VGKPTIYRWWPSKGAIVFDALHQHAQQALPTPPDAPLAERLEIWLKTLFKALNEETGRLSGA
jgi:AcrR family transcriptional regulator